MSWNQKISGRLRQRKPGFIRLWLRDVSNLRRGPGHESSNGSKNPFDDRTAASQEAQVIIFVLWRRRRHLLDQAEFVRPDFHEGLVDVRSVHAQFFRAPSEKRVRLKEVRYPGSFPRRRPWRFPEPAGCRVQGGSLHDPTEREPGQLSGRPHRRRAR